MNSNGQNTADNASGATSEISKKFDYWLTGLFRPVNSASLVFMRITFGIIMLVECWRFYDHGWISRYYIEPAFHFKYYGFEWVEPWAGNGMYWHFVVLAILSIMIAVGLFYRFASITFFFAFSYVFLLDQARYLNHFYLVMIIAFLMMIVPASQTFSLDAWYRARFRNEPWPKEPAAPYWSIWVLRFQMEILLIYAGLVKINADWLRLEPLSMWLASRTEFPLIGPFFVNDWVVALGAYGAIALHIFGAPLLLFRQTRIYVVLAYFSFHLMNHFLFNIGIFPWLTMAATMIFFEPDWPLTLWKSVRRTSRRFIALLGGRVADV